jgi:arabinan endo-1,5-alpha-L-arabinosidase
VRKLGSVRLVLVVLLAALASGCTQPASNNPATNSPTTVPTSATPTATARPGTYTNPVFDHDAPDPGVLRAKDGTYYAYTTQSIYLDIVEIPILASRDLVHWRQVGDAFPQAPDWVVGGAAGDMWAPHPLYWKGKYLLFYSGRRASDGAMAIGLASSASPWGPFGDLGHPLLTRRRGQPTYTAIDPFVLADKGKLWLYWGSNDQPIRVVRLNDTATAVVGRPTTLVQPMADHGSYGGLVEGAWVLPRGSWYYLFYSVGDCCSENANYAVFVARSRTPDGPFRPGPDRPVLHENSHFWAVGHNATARDDAGNDWLVYHARSRETVSEDRVLMLDRIIWSAGWPTLADDTGASWSAQSVPQVTSR